MDASFSNDKIAIWASIGEKLALHNLDENLYGIMLEEMEN